METLSEFRHREFLAWYEEHLLCSTALDAERSPTIKSTLSRLSCLSEDRESLIETPIRFSPPSQGYKREDSQQLNSSISSGEKTPGKKHFKRSVRLQDETKEDERADSIVKRSRTTLSEARGTFVDTQSSIFSARWEAMHGSTGQSPSSCVAKSVQSKFASDLRTERNNDGWDERWSSNINLALCESDEGRAALAQAQQGLLNEARAANCVSRVFLDVAFAESGDLSFAPAVERLQRRLLHRASQAATQTVAAPLVALEWIHRSKNARNGPHNGALLFMYGSTKTGVGHRFGRAVYELNSEGSAKTLSLTRQCGWMTDFEFTQGEKKLRKIMADYQDKDIGKAVANRIMMAQSRGLEVFEFASDSMFLRIMGPWHFTANSRVVILDLKIVLDDSEFGWAVKEFFTRPADEIREILQSTRSSCPERIGRREFGLDDFLNTITCLNSQGHAVACWEDILRAV